MSPPSYEADNIGRVYKIADGEVLPTGRTVPEWASRNDITEDEFAGLASDPRAMDTTDMKVESILYEGFREAYGLDQDEDEEPDE
jgi:hypothetical protein